MWLNRAKRVKESVYTIIIINLLHILFNIDCWHGGGNKASSQAQQVSYNTQLCQPVSNSVWAHPLIVTNKILIVMVIMCTPSN